MKKNKLSQELNVFDKKEDRIKFALFSMFATLMA